MSSTTTDQLDLIDHNSSIHTHRLELFYFMLSITTDNLIFIDIIDWTIFIDYNSSIRICRLEMV